MAGCQLWSIDMKNTILMLGLLASVSTAAADSVGINGGYYKGFYRANGQSVDTGGSAAIGVQYSYNFTGTSALRAQVEVFPNLYDSNRLGFGGELAYLYGIPVAEAANVYVGAGLGLSTVRDSVTSQNVTVNVSATAINPSAIVGLNYAVDPRFSLFTELAGGLSFLTVRGSASNVSISDTITGFYIKPRIGVTYTVR